MPAVQQKVIQQWVLDINSSSSTPNSDPTAVSVLSEGWDCTPIEHLKGGDRIEWDLYPGKIWRVERRVGFRVDLQSQRERVEMNFKATFRLIKD